MLNPRRLLTTPAQVYLRIADARDEYNNLLPTMGEPADALCWAFQTSTSEATVDTDQASEAWTVYLMPAEGDGWADFPAIDFRSIIDIPAQGLRLKVEGQPHTWQHPRTRQPVLVELQGSAIDDEAS